METSAAVGRGVTIISKVMAKLTDGPDFNVLLANGVAAGQEVFHAHHHFIPRAPKDNLGFRWKAGRLPPKCQIEEFLGRVQELIASREEESSNNGAIASSST